jgi:hypothetical protein
MQLNENLTYTYEQIEQLVKRTVRGLDADALAWRPDPEANSVAWLIWHLTRVQDSHIADVAGRQQIWDSEWAQRFGLPPDYTDTGYGHDADDVAAIAPDSADLLTGYHAEVAAMVVDFLADLDEGDFDRVVDERYNPPVTLGVRLVSVISDSLQHAGQAAYVRGLHERA